MTTSTKANDRPNYDTEEGADDGLELTRGQQALEILSLAGFHLRRMVVFAPMFGLVYLVVGFLWYQDVQAEQTLEERSNLQLILLAQPAPRPEHVLQQIEGWDTAYQVTLDSRLSRSEDSGLIDRVIDAASSSGLQVTKIGTTDDDVVTLENDRYTVTPVLMGATGELDGIGRFLDTLETDDFAGFEVQTSILNAEIDGYILTLRGVFYSLPENYGDVYDDPEFAPTVTPINQQVDDLLAGVTP